LHAGAPVCRHVFLVVPDGLRLHARCPLEPPNQHGDPLPERLLELPLQAEPSEHILPQAVPFVLVLDEGEHGRLGEDAMLSRVAPCALFSLRRPWTAAPSLSPVHHRYIILPEFVLQKRCFRGSVLVLHHVLLLLSPTPYPKPNAISKRRVTPSVGVGECDRRMVRSPLPFRSQSGSTTMRSSSPYT